MRWPERVTLAIVTAAGAFLRFSHLGRISLWLDEILSFDIATAAVHAPWWRWIVSTFEPEHGPLFHASLLAGRVAGWPEFSARLAAAIFGTLTIPLVWRAVRAIGGTWAAIAAAVVFAASPLNVYYSREGRPYALLMLLAAAILVALLEGWRARWVLMLSIAAAYTSAVSAPLLVAACTAAIVCAASSGDHRRLYLRASAATLCALLFVPLLYRQDASDTRDDEVRIGLSDVLQAFSVRTVPRGDPDRSAYVVAALALIGAADLVRRDRARGVVVIVMAVVPALAAAAVLILLHHWYSVRYLAAALPGYVVLVGAGAAACASAISRLTPRTAEAVTAGLALLVAMAVAVKGLPAARSESDQKLDWRLIASTIWHRAQPGDLVIATNDWSAVSLDFYLRRLPPRVRFIRAGESAGTIDALTARGEAAWIVVAGYYKSRMFPGWFCRYPLLLASPLDFFGLHYAPSRDHFLRLRASDGERRALTAAFRDAPFSLTFDSATDALLGGGWAGRERLGGDDVRWVMGTEARVFLPFEAKRAHRVRMKIMPFEAAGLPPQQMQVSAGDRLLASMPLASGWNVYEIGVPALTSPDFQFRFSRANAPAAVDRNANDRRPLSAMFAEISVDTVKEVPAGPFASSVRVQEVDEKGSPRYLNANVARERGRSQFNPRTYDRRLLEALAGRCGFDPQFAVPLLLDGRLTIEDLADSLLDRAGCLDDAAFVRNAYWSIIGRSVTDEEAAGIVEGWKSARARWRLVHGLIESSEFRDRMKGAGSAAE